MKILKPGKVIVGYHGKCNSCGCEFIASRDETSTILVHQDNDGCVYLHDSLCPECTDNVTTKPISQKEVDLLDSKIQL